MVAPTILWARTTSCWPWRTQSTQPYMHTESERALGQMDLLNARCVKQDPDQLNAKARRSACQHSSDLMVFHAIWWPLTVCYSGQMISFAVEKERKSKGCSWPNQRKDAKVVTKHVLDCLARRPSTHTHILHHFAVLFLVRQHSQVWLSTKYEI